MSKIPRKEVAARPKPGAGDAFNFPKDAEDDAIAADDPEFADKMRKAEKIATRYCKTLRTLAK